MKHERDNSSEIFSPHQIAVITTSQFPHWYSGKLNVSKTHKVRGDLALQTIDSAIDKGYNIFVADSSQSSNEFQKELLKRDIALVPRTTAPGIEVSDRLVGFYNAIKEAMQNPEIQVGIVTQIEKVSLIEKCVPLIAPPLLTKKADMVVPTRNEELFKQTYPDYQYLSETDANRKANKLLQTAGLLPKGNNLDIFFGVWAFRRDEELLKSIYKAYMYINETREQIRKTGFELISYPFINGLKNRKRVISIEVPFRYPIDQKNNETVLSQLSYFLKYRQDQHDGILVELEQYIRHLKNEKDSSVVEVNIEKYE